MENYLPNPLCRFNDDVVVGNEILCEIFLNLGPFTDFASIFALQVSIAENSENNQAQCYRAMTSLRFACH